MANWNLPTVTSGYLDFVAEMNNKFVDAGTIGFGAPTNLPENAMRYNRSINIFEEWVAGAWNAKTIALAGGGTGASTAAGARTNLGIGSMGTQNSNAVAITGGSITGVNIDAGGINTGVVALARGGTGTSLSLPPLGYIFVSSGSQIQFDSGINISQLNAGALIGTVNDARLSANVPLKNAPNVFTSNNDFQGYLTFSNTPGINSPTIVGVTPLINFYDVGNSANNHYYRIAVGAGSYFFQSLDDSYGGGLTYGSLTASGFVVGTGAGLIYANGSPLTNLNASNLATGIVPTARLGSGAAHAGTFLRGDGTWAPMSGGGEVSPIPSGLIAIFDTGCPAGWTRVSGLDDRFPRGSPSYGSTGGRWSHAHGVGGQTGAAGGHSHSFSGSGSGSGSGRTGELDSAMNFQPGPNLGAGWSHTHPFSVNVNVSVEGNTGGVGDHAHSFNVGTSEEDHTLPYMTVVFCRKN